MAKEPRTEVRSRKVWDSQGEKRESADGTTLPRLHQFLITQSARAPHVAQMKSATRRFQILSLDGGGIKGLFSAAILANWEEDFHCTIADHFDLIVGTSTGGVIALGLGLGLRPREIVDFYRTNGAEIFSTGLLPGYRAIRQYVRSKFSVNPLREALKLRFGENLLGHSTKRLVIPAFDLGHGELRVFKTSHHDKLRRDFRLPAWKVALSTGAAPTYFPAFRDIEDRRLIDGGVWANNPVMVGLVEAMTTLEVPIPEISILSLGTTDAVKRRPDRLDHGGYLQWSRHAADVIMASQSVAATAQARLLIGDERFVRVDAKVPDGVFRLDGLPDDKLVAAANHQSLCSNSAVAAQFLTHLAPQFKPCHTI